MRGSIVGITYYTVFEYPFEQNHVFLPLRQRKRRIERDLFGRPYDEAAEAAAMEEFERRQRARREERRAELLSDGHGAAPRARVVRPPRTDQETLEMQRSLRLPPSIPPRDPGGK